MGNIVSFEEKRSKLKVKYVWRNTCFMSGNTPRFGTCMA